MNFFVFLSVLLSCNAFSVSKISAVKSSALNAIPQNTFVVAELYSGPAATYNGQLISESLKAVPVTQTSSKPANYEYGAVSQDGTPILAIGLLLSVFIAAAVPFLLSIGEGAQAQQREREIENKVGTNLFAQKAREQKKTPGSKK